MDSALAVLVLKNDFFASKICFYKTYNLYLSIVLDLDLC